MKKIAILSLLTIFLFNTVGYYIVFQIGQYTLKKELKSQIKRGIKDNEYTIITIDKDKLKDVEWVDSGKEMFYNTELYDIIKKTEMETSVIFYCISDKKEKVLYANLKKHVQTHISTDPGKRSHSKKISDHLVKVYFSKQFQIIFDKKDLSQNMFNNFILLFSSEYLEINSPPPELV